MFSGEQTSAQRNEVSGDLGAVKITLLFMTH